MAKKRRKHEEKKEEKEYKPPEFDRKEFMETEINVAKGTIYAVLLSIPLAALGFLVLPIVGTAGGLMVALGGVGLLWLLLPLLGIEIIEFKPMHWLGVISSYVFMFLAIWVLLCNPPFSDQAAPDINNVQVSWDSGMGFLNQTGTTVDIPQGANVTIRARVTDNEAILAGSVSITIGTGTPMDMTSVEEHEYEFEIQGAQEAMWLVIAADDVNGHHSEFRVDFI